MKDFFAYQLYIFDLDNTLYSENDYLFGAYEAIATALGKKEAGDFLKTTFLKEGRSNLFDKLVKEFSLDSDAMVSSLDILRTYNPQNKLSAYPDLVQLLDKLKSEGKQLALLTNGTPQQQQNKIKNITPALEDYFPFIVLANEIEKKPSPKAVYHILEQTGIAKEDSLMIGDDKNDEVTAINAAVDFIYVDELRKQLK